MRGSTRTAALKAFTVPVSASTAVDISIAEPDLRADNLNLTTWTSSFILACQLHTFKVSFRDDAQVPVLELGAGTGLVGLTAATIWRKRVVLTDLPGIVPGLRTNIDLHSRTLDATSANVKCGSLDWNAADLLTLEDGTLLRPSEGAKASIILAADTIYDEAHPEVLSNVIITWLARSPHARAILCYPLRVAYLDQIRCTWGILEGAGLVAETEGQKRVDQNDWDDEGLCEWVVFKWNNV